MPNPVLLYICHIMAQIRPIFAWMLNVLVEVVDEALRQAQLIAANLAAWWVHFILLFLVLLIFLSNYASLGHLGKELFIALCHLNSLHLKHVAQGLVQLMGKAAITHMVEDLLGRVVSPFSPPEHQLTMCHVAASIDGELWAEGALTLTAAGALAHMYIGL